MSRTLTRVMTNDEADFRLLSLANEKRKFGIAVGLKIDPALQFALERGIDNEWFTLVDISATAICPSQVLRIFRLTDAGLKRLAEVSAVVRP